MKRRSSAAHSGAADLVRSVTRANRVDSTHVRTVLAHVKDRRGVLEALLDPEALKRSIDIDLAADAWTVEAFACQLMGTSFHTLSFSLRPNPEGPFATTLALNPVELTAAEQPDDASGWEPPTVLDSARLAAFDTARRAMSLFDGTTNEEFLVELPHTEGSDAADDIVWFRAAAAEVAGLTTKMGVPLAFMHAPVAFPASSDVPRGVTGPCLRFGVAFPILDASRRLSFGTKLISRCCKLQYGLWQRATTAEHGYDYWDVVVSRRPTRAGEAPPAPSAANGRSGRRRALAVTCVGPVRAGTTEAVLKVLERARAPLVGLSETWLDDISIIHLLTTSPLARRAIDALVTDVRADVALGRALGMAEPDQDERLRDYRALVSRRAERKPDPQLAALWLGWATPATPVALALTVKTLRVALDDTAARYGAAFEGKPRKGHLNVEYLVCRESLGADRLVGRARVSVDLDALQVTRDGAGRAADRVSASELGRFCSDLERLWRTSLSFALGTAHVALDVVWRESWLGRWATLRARPGDDRW